jgi:hypothetical protein
VNVTPEDFTQGQGEMDTEIYLPFVHYAKSLSSSYHDKEEKKEKVELELDIDTKITHGKYTTRGQYLTWTYPRPSSATTYTIEVTRKGGAIVREVSTGTGYVQGGSWSDVCGGCVIA